MSTISEAKWSAGRAHWDAQAQRALHKVVAILVEGDDDKEALERALAVSRPDWDQRAVVIAVEGRAGVLQALRQDALPNGLRPTDRLVGVVDRDTWDDGEVQDEARRLPGLVVTDGWDLESSLLVHDAGHLHALAGAREAWVQASALGWARQRAYAAWQAPAASWAPDPSAPLDFTDLARLDASILARGLTFSPSPDAMSPMAVARAAWARWVAVQAWSHGDQWLRAVHGKEAFRQLLVPHLNKGRRPHGTATWRNRLAERLDTAPWFQRLLSTLP